MTPLAVRGLAQTRPGVRALNIPAVPRTTVRPLLLGSHDSPSRGCQPLQSSGISPVSVGNLGSVKYRAYGVSDGGVSMGGLLCPSHRRPALRVRFGRMLHLSWR